jgi:fibronectin type 3 domain-containing protein
LWGQKDHEGYLFPRNTDDGRIQLKWITNKVLYEEGYNLYRATSGEWVKINSTPFAKPANVPADLASKDKDAEMFFAMIKQEGSMAQFHESFTRLFVLIHSVENNDFAQSIGISYIDSEVQQGTNYKYRLTALWKGKEIEIADTNITVGPKEAIAPPKEVSIERKKTKVELYWKVDKLAYYGVHIFRTNLNTGQTEQITKGPVVLQASDVVSATGKKLPCYKDEGLDKEASYAYQLKVMDYFGEIGDPSETLNAVAKDEDPPMDPFNLKADQETLRVRLDWMSVIDEDRAGFNMYRFTDTITNAVKVSKEPIHKDSSTFWDEVPQAGNYYYFVSAFDLAGNEAASQMIFTQVRDVIPPAPPTNLSTRTDSGKVHLTWNAPPDRDIWGYVIWKVIEGEENHPDDYTLVNSDFIKNTDYTEVLHKNVKTAFRYVVQAVDTHYNRSKYSDFSVAKLPDYLPPVSPFIRSVDFNAEKQRVEITWEPNKDDDIFGYNLYRSEGNDSNAIRELLTLAPMLINETTYTDKDVKPGLRYVYYLRALDDSRNISEWSNAFSIVIPGQSEENAVKLKTFTVKAKGGQGADLRWKPDNADRVAGYVLFRQEDNGNLMPHTGKLTDTRFRDKGLKEGKTYAYQLRLYSRDGNVIKSDTKTISISSKK